jgi:hypothetical protein
MQVMLNDLEEEYEVSFLQSKIINYDYEACTTKDIGICVVNVLRC